MNPWYTWRPKPELVRFVAVTTLTYIVEIARRYSVGEFNGVLEWGPVIVGLVIGGAQFVGARLLAVLPDTRPPGQRDLHVGADGHPATNPPRWGEDWRDVGSS